GREEREQADEALFCQHANVRVVRLGRRNRTFDGLRRLLYRDIHVPVDADAEERLGTKDLESLLGGCEAYVDRRRVLCACRERLVLLEAGRDREPENGYERHHAEEPPKAPGAKSESCDRDEERCYPRRAEQHQRY